MEWILVIAYTFLFLAIIRKLKFFDASPVSLSWVMIAFLCKVIAGIALGLIYTYYYTDRSTADTFKFFDDSGILFNSIFNRPYDFFRMFTGIHGSDPDLHHYYVDMNAWLNKDVLFNDNKTLIRLNTFFRFFSLGHYYVHVVFLNFISFTGLFFLFRTFGEYVATKKRELFFLVFFLPSVMFWGSGLLKDGLLLFALGGMVYSFRRIVEKKSDWKNHLFFVCCLGLLVFTKFYVLAILFPGLIAWYLSSQDSGKKVIFKFGIIYLIYLLAAFNLGRIWPQYRVTDVLYWKQQNFYVLAASTHARSVIEIPALDYTVSTLLKNTPMALVNALTRPTLVEAGTNPLMLLSAVENTFLVFLILLTLISLRKENLKVTAFPVLSFVFVILMLTLIGLITPILGALVRYKIVALPFLVFILVRLYDREKLASRFSFLKKSKG